jgi:hypothetical protein
MANSTSGPAEALMEFVSPDPKAQVRAANVRATLAAFPLMPGLGRQIVERYRINVEDLAPDAFLPVQRWLDALKEIQHAIGPNKVREVGRNIIENAEFPPQFNDAESILEALDQIYYANHRGDVGHYVVTRTRPDEIVVRCETPYPRAFERGLVEGIVRNRRAHGTFSVAYTDGPPAGALTCTLTVHRV